MKTLIASLAAIAAVAAAVPASAQVWTPVRDREAKLTQRIDQGVRSGELTRREAVNLRMDLRNIERLEDRYRVSGGRLDMRERADLEARFDRLSSRVFANKHIAPEHNNHHNKRHKHKNKGRGHKAAPFSYTRSRLST